MKKLTIIFVLLLFLNSCKKDNLEFKNETKIESPTKKTRIAPHATLLLIPSGTTERVGFICDGFVQPALSYIPSYDLICGVGTSPTYNQPFYYNILNPSLFAGLPKYIASPKLTGIALTGTNYQYTNMPDIYLSYSDNLNHYLLTATLVGNDYIITSMMILTCNFAPASSGWKLHDIEYSNGRLYGLLNEKNTNNTKFIEIIISTGICIQKNHLTGMRCSGLDIIGNKAYLLLFEDINSSLYGKIIEIPIGSLVLNVLDLEIPSSNPSHTLNVTWGTPGYDENYFLSASPFESGYLNFYNDGNTSGLLWKYNLNTPATPALVASYNSLYYDIINNNFSSAPLSFIITDSAN